MPEITYQFYPSGVPAHRLKLKKGVPVMVIRSLLHPDLVNGKLLVVQSHSRSYLSVERVEGDGSEWKIYTLSRIKLQFSLHGFILTRKQFPVRLSFSGNVYKIQGNTLEKKVVDLRSQFF